MTPLNHIKWQFCSEKISKLNNIPFDWFLYNILLLLEFEYQDHGPLKNVERKKSEKCIADQKVEIIERLVEQKIQISKQFVFKELKSDFHRNKLKCVKRKKNCA